MENLRILGYPVFDIFFYFILYSFLGWCIEIVYAFFKNHRFINRGFLYGPFCPIYGSAALIITISSEPIRNNYLEVFIFCFVIASSLEYITGYLLEKIFDSKWWDYSEDPLNLHGRICLLYSILWAILGVVIIKIINSLIDNLIVKFVSKNLELKLVYILITYFLVDLTITLIKLVELKKLFVQLEEVTNEIKSKLINIKTTASEKALNLEKIPEEIKNKYEYIIDNIVKKYGRLFIAFPEFNSKILKKSFDEIRSRLKK